MKNADAIRTTAATMVSSSHPAFPRDPNCQNTIMDRAVSLNMYCRALIPAENIELIATPARTMVSADTVVSLTSAMITPVAIIDHRKAQMVMK